MTAYEATVLWCVVQVAIVAGLGAVATWLLSRRAPGAAATAAAGAAATVLVVTLLAPVPLAGIFDGGLLADVASDARTAAGGARLGSALEERRGVGFDLSALVTRGLVGVGELVRAKPQAAGEVEAWIGVVFVAGAGVGLLRLAGAALYMRRLRRGCLRVVDAATCEAFEDLARRLGVRRPVALCESRELASPAVLGWRRPIVLLPASRDGWTEEQLRATLAHELAHVVRGDFAWRLAASCVRAIHFVHPLVHVLTRRLALAQELAADRLAATAAGGSTNYLRALSELALRLDDRVRLRAEPLVLPALSTHLTRRIAMLRSTEGSVETKRKRLIGVAAAGLIALVGAGTTALRGAAEAVGPTVAAASESALFARPPLDLSILGGPHQGLFVVRLSELSQKSAFAPVVEALHENYRAFWPQLFSSDAPELNLSIIEYIAGVPKLTIGPLKNSDDPNMTGMMMVGCGELVIRFTGDVAWESWIKQHIPAAEAKSEDGLAYVKLPAMPRFGEARMLVAAHDSRTLVCTWEVDRLRTLLTGIANDSTIDETAPWDALDGGLATFVANDAHVDRSMPTPKAPQAQDVLEHVRRYGVGFDVDAATNQAGLRFDLACADAASAERVRNAVVECTELLRKEIRAGITTIPHVSGGQDAKLQIALFWSDAIDNSTIELAPQAGGSVSVRISARAKFPTQLTAAQEVAEKTDAPITTKR